MQRFLPIIGLLFCSIAAIGQSPATAPGGFSATCTDAGTASWTNPGTVNTIVVFAKQGSAITTGTNTTDVDDYDDDSNFGDGSPFEHDAAAFCVYKGTSNSVSITNLTAGATYHFIVYNVNNTTYSTAYTFSGATLAAPPEVTGLTNTPGDSEIDLSWTNPGCSDNVLIVARAGGAITGAPTATSYTFDQDFGAAPTATSDGFPSASEKIVYFGTASPQTITGLTNGTAYHFKVFVLKGSTWSAGVSTNGTPTDTSPPTVVSLTPSDGNDEVSISTTQLVIEFNENIEKVAGAATTDDHRIILYRSPSTAVATLDRTSASIAVSGNTATITFNPPYQLLTNTNYHVIVGNQVFRDIDGSNAVFTGLTNSSDWNFETSGVSITSPSLSACSGVYQTLGDILIDENGNNDFNNDGGTRTLTFAFDATGFVFEPNSTVNVTMEGTGSPVGTNVTITSAVTTFTTLTINYTVSGTDRKERMRISGLRVSPDGTQPSATIIRTGGNANLDGGNGTGGSSLTFATITSGTLPGTPNGSNLTLNFCQGDVIAAGPNITTNNANVRWYSDAALTTLISSLNNETNINTGTELTNLGFVTTSAGTITRYVTQTSGGCQSLARTVTLTVQAKPTVDLIITAGSNNLCTNYLNGAPVHQPIQLTASPSGGTNYHFQRNGSITLQNGASRVFNGTSNDFNNGDLVTVTVTVPGSCPSTSSAITITKNTGTAVVSFEMASPPPGTPATTPEFSNQQTPVQLVGTPGGGTFSGVGIFDDYFHPQSLPTGSYDIEYRVTDGNGCTGISRRTFTVYDGGTAFTGLNSSYCADDAPFQITVNARPGYTFLYLLPQNYYFGPYLLPGSIVSGNGFDVTGPNEPNWFQGFSATSGPITINPFLITDNGTVQKTIRFFGYYQRNSDGVDEARVQEVTFYPRPGPPIVAVEPGYCLDSPTALENVIQVTGPDLKWYNDENLTDERVALAGNDSPTLQDLGIASAGTYFRYVTQNTGCESNPREVQINVFSQPPAPAASSPPAYCSGSPIANLTATGTALSWYTELPAVAANRIPTVNPASATALELSIPNNTLTPVTHTRYVTQTISGCQSLHAAVNVTVNPIPVPPGSSFDRTYCLNATIPANQFVVSGSNVRWYTDPGLTMQVPGIANQNNVTPAELGVNTSSPSIKFFYVTQTVTSCQSTPITVRVEVQALPSVSFTASEDLLTVCQTDARIKITASPPLGSWSGSGSDALVNTNSSAGTTELNPAALAAGQDFELTYSFVGDCSNNFTLPITLFPTVSPSLAVGLACNGFAVDIENTSVISPNLPSTAIDSIFWDFGDGEFLRLAPAEEIINASNTTGTYSNLSHLFQGGSNLVARPYTLKYTLKTTDGCIVSGTEPVTINPVPNANFTWTNVCVDSPTTFHATTSPDLDDDIDTYTWNFNTLGAINVGVAGTGKDPVTIYNSTGRDTVQLIVKTFDNCRDTVRRAVFIVPHYGTINESNSYQQDFTTQGGWIDGGRNSSWEFGKPAGTIINRDSSATGLTGAWKTNNISNLYNPLEKSWVLSGCFTIESDKPVISLDIWADTPGGVDGAVLQYLDINNGAGNIEVDSQWKVIGTVNSGINWYEQQGIASKPGNQSDSDYGWSGNRDDGRYAGWNHAIHKLDEASNKTVVFRIAFASGLQQKEGFAFDNIFIGERNRNVLVENFTNSSAITNSEAHNENYNDFPDGASTEIIKLQYHTSFPGADPLNAADPEVNNARAAFYGITSAPTIRIDGSYQNGAPFSWAETVYDSRVLNPSALIIDIQTPIKLADGSVKLNAVITNTSESDVPLQGVNAFIAVVERSIDDAAWLGDGGDEFINVVRQMLPSASGIPLNVVLGPGETLDLEELMEERGMNELVWSRRNLISETPGNSAIIIFLQRTNASNQQVLQAEMITNPVEPDLVTGTEDPEYADRINLFPNPASHEVNIQLPAAVIKPTTFTLIDAFGRVVYQSLFETGERVKTVSTGTFADGIYILQLAAPQGSKVVKKVMVRH